MNAAGDVIATHEGPRTVAAFEETGKKAQAYLDLKKKADGGDKSAKIDLAIADLDAGRLKADEIDKKLEGLGDLSADQKKALAGAKANGEVRAIYEPLMKAQDPESAKKLQAEVCEKLAARKKAGGAVPTGAEEWEMYWGGLLSHAEKKRDAALYEEAFLQIKAKYASEPMAKQALDKMQKTLDALKAGKAPPTDDDDDGK